MAAQILTTEPESGPDNGAGSLYRVFVSAQVKTSSIRLFKNPVLEALTHVHPIVPLLMWAPVVAYLQLLTHRAGLDRSGVVAMGLVGFIFWTLTEYVLHRFAFHYRAGSAFAERMVYLAHGNHHDQPQDATRLVMPPLPALILATLLYLFFRVLLGTQWVMPFFSGFLVGYLCYDYIHYGVHHYMPRSSIGRFLKNHHMKHHFMTHGARWGVSTPLWDLVFGTMDEKIPAKVKRGA